MSRLPRLIVYARTSTDDQQSPQDSLAWQVSLAVAWRLAGARSSISSMRLTPRARSPGHAGTRRPRSSPTSTPPIVHGTGSSSADRSERSGPRPKCRTFSPASLKAVRPCGSPRSEGLSTPTPKHTTSSSTCSEGSPRLSVGGYKPGSRRPSKRRSKRAGSRGAGHPTAIASNQPASPTPTPKRPAGAPSCIT